MGKRGVLQKGFLLVVFLILAVAGLVSYMGRSSTGGVIADQEQQDLVAEEDSYSGMCGLCSESKVCTGAKPNDSCIFRKTIGGTVEPGVCMTQGPCNRYRPTSGLDCLCVPKGEKVEIG